MLAKYTMYRRSKDEWGLWTTGESTTAVFVLVRAMRKFPDNVDMQSCAIAALVAMCSPVAQLESVVGQTDVCQAAAVETHALALAVTAMRIHGNSGLHTHVCKLIRLFPDGSTLQVHLHAVLMAALRYNLSTAHFEGMRHVIRLLSYLIAEDKIDSGDFVLLANASTTILHVLELLLAHIDTEEPAVAIQNHDTMQCAAILMNMLCVYQIHIRTVVTIPNATQIVLKCLHESHRLAIAPPPALFLVNMGVRMDDCYEVQMSLSGVLLEIDACEFREFHTAEAIAILLDIIKDTEYSPLQRALCNIIDGVAFHDNDETNLILNAKGLETIACMMRAPARPSPNLISRILELCLHLAEKCPGYKAAMLQLNFVDLWNAQKQKTISAQKNPSASGEQLVAALLQGE